MDTVQFALRRLLIGFVIWFVLQAVLGTAVAVIVMEALRHHPLLADAMRGVTTRFTVASGIVGSIVLFVLAMPVFTALLDRKRWARLLLLIFGWITVAGVVISLLGVSGRSEFARVTFNLSSADWPAIQAGTVLTQVIDLAFWAWVIATLQVNAVVREAFLCVDGPSHSRPSRS